MMSHARRIEADRRVRHAVPLARLRDAGVWLVLALLRWHELTQQRRTEGRQVGRLAGGDERSVDDHLPVYPFRACIDEVCTDAGP